MWMRYGDGRTGSILPLSDFDELLDVANFFRLVECNYEMKVNNEDNALAIVKNLEGDAGRLQRWLEPYFGSGCTSSSVPAELT